VARRKGPEEEKNKKKQRRGCPFDKRKRKPAQFLWQNTSTLFF
jgi:hypothetical protein